MNEIYGWKLYLRRIGNVLFCACTRLIYREIKDIPLTLHFVKTMHINWS